MSVTNINDYIALKASLNTQILSDDTILNLQSIVDNIATLKTTITTNYTSETVLDDASGVSTVNKFKWVRQISLCLDSDSELIAILQSAITRCDTQIKNSDGSDLIALRERIVSLRTMLCNKLPCTRINLIREVISNKLS